MAPSDDMSATLPLGHLLMYRPEMKRLTPRFKKWLEFRQTREMKRRRRPRQHSPSRPLKKPILRNNPPVYLFPPRFLSFSQNREQTVLFFHEVRQAIDRSLRKHTRLIVELSALKALRPAAALCLLAEFDRWQRLLRQGPLSPVTLDSWAPEIVRNLSDMGFFELLGTPVAAHLRDGGPGAAKYIRFVTGDIADAEKQARFRRLVGSPLATQSPLTLGLYRSLGEAINNAVEHAYEDGRQPEPIGRRWWLTGVVDEAARRLRVVILDHGMSIPGSLHRTEHGPLILRYLDKIWPGRTDDGSKIEAAMEYGRSRMGLPGRGKGLGDVVALAMLDPRNRLRVISRKGSYIYDKDGGRSENVECPLNGTFVEWDLVLPSRSEFVPELQR